MISFGSLHEDAIRSAKTEELTVGMRRLATTSFSHLDGELSGRPPEYDRVWRDPLTSEVWPSIDRKARDPTGISGQQTIDLSHLGRVQPLPEGVSILYDDQLVVPKFKPSTTCLSDARLSASTVAIHQHKVSTWSPQREQLAIFVTPCGRTRFSSSPTLVQRPLKTLFNSRFISDQRFLSIGGQRCPNVSSACYYSWSLIFLSVAPYSAAQEALAFIPWSSGPSSAPFGEEIALAFTDASASDAQSFFKGDVGPSRGAAPTNIVSNGGFEIPVVARIATYGAGQTLGEWMIETGYVDVLSGQYWQPAEGLQVRGSEWSGNRRGLPRRGN